MCGICCCLYLARENPEERFKIFEDSILPYLQRRGPDHVGKKEYLAQTARGRIHLALVGTVLHLRGHKTPQPLEDEHGNILLWNGEIFGGIQVEEGENDSQVLLKALGCYPSGVSPSQHVLLTMAKVQGPWSFIYWQPGEHKLWFGRDYFGRRSLLWHLPSNSKDILAITSVAERKSAAHEENLHMQEVPADGVYCVDCLSDSKDQELEQPFRISKYDWLEEVGANNRDFAMFLPCPVTPFYREIPTPEDLSVIDENRRKISFQRSEIKNGETHVTGERSESLGQGTGVSRLNKVAEGNCVFSHCKEVETTREYDAKERRVTRLRSDFGRHLSGISYSDCFQADACSSSSNVVPRDCLRSEHLASLSSGPESKANSGSSCRNVGAASETGPSSRSTELPFCVSSSEEREHSHPANVGPDGFIPREKLMKSRSPQSRWNSVYRIYQEMFINILGDAVKKRVFNLPRIEADCPQCSWSSNLTRTVPRVEPALSAVPLKTKNEARVGILFSGGIDSMMLAALANRFVPSEEVIDLVNVAFEQKTQTPNRTKHRRKRKEHHHSSEECTSTERERNFNVPDRVTGIEGLLELQSLNPSRQWNFVEVNVTIEELREMRSRYISHLVSPLNTVLDDSIGCALWFAARGRGSLRRSVNCGEVSGEMRADAKDREYTTTAKVLLVGMGADEQLGGYARHRTHFINDGWSGLMEEIEMDVKRISKRNLGRDDRCISDHGREARFPFLDEGVVSFLNSLPVWVKADPGLPRGTGEKLLLRQAARMLGLTSSSELPKRAIQFGSRIAKLESAGEKGSETCPRLSFGS